MYLIHTGSIDEILVLIGMHIFWQEKYKDLTMPQAIEVFKEQYTEPEVAKGIANFIENLDYEKMRESHQKIEDYKEEQLRKAQDNRIPEGMF